MYEKHVYEKLSDKQIRKTDTKKNQYEKLSFGKEMLCVAHQKNPRKKFTRDIGSSSTEPGIRKKRLREKIVYEKTTIRKTATKKQHRDKVP